MCTAIEHLRGVPVDERRRATGLMHRRTLQQCVDITLYIRCNLDEKHEEGDISYLSLAGFNCAYLIRISSLPLDRTYRPTT